MLIYLFIFFFCNIITIGELKVTNIVKLYTILLLYEGPKHGYAIIMSVGEKLGRRISPGQIYPFLKKLEEYKYVEHKGAEEREKKVYSLTEKGKEFVNSMLSRFGSLIDIAIEPRLKVCAHCGCKLYSGGHKERIGKKEIMFCCMHCAASYKKERS